MTISEQNLRDMYLDIMQDVLTNEIYKDPPLTQDRSFSKKVKGVLGL